MRILFVLLLIFGVVVSSRADEVQQLQADNRLLQAELELARTGQLYMVFDLSEHQVQFKLSGVAATRLTLTDVRFWGPAPAEKVRLLLHKEEVKSAEREKIKVTSAEAEPPPVVTATPAEVKPAGEEPPKTFALQALELDDMPAQYHLILDDGIRISVRSSHDVGIIDFFRDKAERLWWYLSRPLVSLWQYFKGKTYTEVVLTLPRREAQLLYWSFSEGAPCLLRRPAAAE